MSKLEEYKKYVEEELKNHFDYVAAEKHSFYLCKDDTCFDVVGFRAGILSTGDAIFLEYADSREYAEEYGCVEDGDWYFIDEMTKEELLQNLIDEVNGCTS